MKRGKKILLNFGKTNQKKLAGMNQPIKFWMIVESLFIIGLQGDQ